MLTCTTCGADVEVYEFPREWIDPLRYRCGECVGAVAPQLGIAVEPGSRIEERRYDPAQAVIPF